MDEASREVAAESGLVTEPPAELLVVDRQAWIAGNVRTLGTMFGEVGLQGSEATVLAWEGGAFLGLLARAVLAQYDPYRDLLLVVYPNLGDVARGNGLRWLVFHEMTHLAQFRSAPWMSDHIVELGRSILDTDRRGWAKEAAQRLRERLPDLIRWARAVLEGKAEGSPLLDILPEQQREIVMRLHALVTLLEGHATYVTDLIAARVIPDYEAFQRRITARRRRSPVVRLLEAAAGLEMKRQQYVIGRGFCESVWAEGGAAALAPAWKGPDTVPTLEELRAPERWLERVA
jgi:coenzyme F420 biosynthesis associated uncharacterized protein